MRKQIYNINEEFDPFDQNNLIWDVEIIPTTFRVKLFEEDLMSWNISIFLNLKKDTPHSMWGYHSLLFYRFKWMQNQKNSRVLARHELEREDNKTGAIVGLSKVMLYKQDITKGIINLTHNLTKEMMFSIQSDWGKEPKIALKC